MLVLPKENNDPIIKTVAFDPGTTKLGVSVMHIDLNDLLIKKTYAFTLNGEKLANNLILSEHYGPRYSRISGMSQEIANFINYIEPIAISSEAPFFNSKFPGAFMALVEVIDSIRNVVFQYDPYKPLHLVDPSSVKNAVGAKGGANKFTIRDAVISLTNLNYESTVKIEDLDEHSIDSIAVNYWHYLKNIVRVI